MSSTTIFSNCCMVDVPLHHHHTTRLRFIVVHSPNYAGENLVLLPQAESQTSIVDSCLRIAVVAEHGCTHMGVWCGIQNSSETWRQNLWISSKKGRFAEFQSDGSWRSAEISEVGMLQSCSRTRQYCTIVPPRTALVLLRILYLSLILYLFAIGRKHCTGHGTHKNPSVVALSHRQILSMNRQEYAQHVYGHPLEDTFWQIRMSSPFARCYDCHLWIKELRTALAWDNVAGGSEPSADSSPSLCAQSLFRRDCPFQLVF